MLAPILVVMLYPITCAFIYVGFREIFLNKKENNTPQQKNKEVKSYKLS
jgi:hypothetical protein